MRIHTAFRPNGIPAFSVNGALSDHHRLIRQFGAVPLMYYLYGENVINKTTERILTGPVYRSIPLNHSTNHQCVERRMYTTNKILCSGLDIPMAVTEAAKQQAITTKIGKTDARNESQYCAFGRRFENPAELTKLSSGAQAFRTSCPHTGPHV